MVVWCWVGLGPAAGPPQCGQASYVGATTRWGAAGRSTQPSSGVTSTFSIRADTWRALSAVTAESPAAAAVWTCPSAGSGLAVCRVSPCQGERTPAKMETESRRCPTWAKAEVARGDRDFTQQTGASDSTSDQGEGLGFDSSSPVAHILGWYRLPIWAYPRIAGSGVRSAYGVFPSQPAYPLTLDDVLSGWQAHNKNILSQLRPGRDDEFLLKQSIVDAEKGFCTFPMSRTALLQTIHGQAHRLIPRCVITQSSGKQRVIDNADTGGQSERSQDANKLQLCSPFRPAQQIALTMQYMTQEELQAAQASDAWQTGGEDWPDAYRHSPMSRQECLGCVVTFWHHEWQTPAFQLYGGLLFGLPLAVTSFNRYSKLVESLGRRLTGCLVSMYFDDANIVDWCSSQGSSQWAFSQLNHLLGTPFASEKKQMMASSGTFLGLTHDLSSALQKGMIRFWIRDRLQEKMLTTLNTAMTNQALPPSTAAKLYGVANFFEQAVYGRIGCGGLAAIKQRQYEHTNVLTTALTTSFQILRSVIKAKPERPFAVFPQATLRFCAASDAALEAPGQGTGGFLLIWYDQGMEIREAFVADIPPAIYALWEPGTKKIAQLEMMMVLYALVARPAYFRQRRGLWLIDNIAALMCLVRGRSESPDLERISSLIHLASFALKTWLWWEYIQSKSNWADAISRLGVQDPWYRANGFTISIVSFPVILWHLPFAAVIRCFEFLWVLWEYLKCIGLW